MGCSINLKGISETGDHTFVLSSDHSLERAQLEDTCKIIKSRMAILDIAGEAEVEDDNVIVRIKQNKQIDIEILCKRGNIQFLDKDANILLDNSKENFIQSSETKKIILNEGNQYMVCVTISPLYVNDFAKITQQNVGENLYIVIDNKLYVNPVIENEIHDGEFQINLGGDEEAAKRLSYLLTLDCLAYEFEVITQH